MAEMMTIFEVRLSVSLGPKKHAKPPCISEVFARPVRKNAEIVLIFPCSREKPRVAIGERMSGGKQF